MVFRWLQIGRRLEPPVPSTGPVGFNKGGKFPFAVMNFKVREVGLMGQTLRAAK
jgi:hypothetical protein